MVVTDLALLLGWAVVLGAIVGLLPGLNPLMGLILTLPFITWAPVWMILIFWTCYLTVTQYYGSVGAILFKVPTETSSVPVLNASRTITGTRGVVRSLRVTAFSGIVASTIGVAGFAVLCLVLQNSWSVLFRTSISVIFLALMTVLVLSRQGAWLRNSILASVGLVLSNMADIPAVGNWCGQAAWTCFALKPTDVGLAIICLYAMPYLFVSTSHFDSRRNQNTTNLGWIGAVGFWPIAVRHAVLGWFIGFVPGLGVVLSSNTSAELESGPRPRRLRVMSAAEAANNSSVISCTVPFLFVGLPITGTELLMDNWLLVNKSAGVDAHVLYQSVAMTHDISAPMWVIMLTCLSLVSIICFYMTSRFAKMYLVMNQIPAELFGTLIKLSILGFTWLMVHDSDLTVGSTLFTLVFFTAMGVWSQRYAYDIVALPISLMVGSFAISKFYIAYQLWS